MKQLVSITLGWFFSDYRLQIIVFLIKYSHWENLYCTSEDVLSTMNLLLVSLVSNCFFNCFYLLCFAILFLGLFFKNNRISKLKEYRFGLIFGSTYIILRDLVWFKTQLIEFSRFDLASSFFKFKIKFRFGSKNFMFRFGPIKVSFSKLLVNLFNLKLLHC